MPRLFTGLEIPAEVGLELSHYRGGLPGARGRNHCRSKAYFHGIATVSFVK